MLKSQVIHQAFLDATWRRTVDRVGNLPSYARLSLQQKKLVLAYVLSGSALHAVHFAYTCKSPESYRVMSYGAFKSPKVEACLSEIFPSQAIKYLLNEIERASKDPKTTMPQVEALKLRALMMGLLPSQAGQHVGESEPAEVAK